jgi:hypothetical protein
LYNFGFNKKIVNYFLNESSGTLVIIMLMIERFCYVMFVLPKM